VQNIVEHSVRVNKIYSFVKFKIILCSILAQVKAIEKQVKLKVTLFDSGDTITISEEQLVHAAQLRIGNTVTVRITSSNRRQSNDSNSHHQHYSRSGLAAFINPTNPDEKQATIKQIIDNSIYTVVFNDGDEKSLRRSSLCLQGIRLYQTQYGQQKILEEIPTSPPPSLPATSETTNTNANDSSSIVAIKRQGNSDVFPAYVLKRKALADYMWVRSFVDGREYIVHTRDDVQSYQNPEIQALCRSTSKQATQACEKFIKYNQIPAVWQKKKKKQTKSDNKNAQSDAENSSSNDSSSSESDDEDDEDEIDEETTEEKDSFVAQLFAFMDDRGTPINNIPKVQNYDLDLHRLFKIVRMFGGYNKV
jgi:Ras-related protein Rab-1A